MQRICASLVVVFYSFCCGFSHAADPPPDRAEVQQAGNVEKNPNAPEIDNTATEKKKVGPNAGEDDLFEATQRKVNSQSFGDLKEVILLCESAIRKGLDKQNRNFAKLPPILS